MKRRLLRTLVGRVVSTLLTATICLNSVNFEALVAEAADTRNEYLYELEDLVGEPGEPIENPSDEDKREEEYPIPEMAVFEGDSFNVISRVEKNWETGFNAVIELINTGDAIIDNWTLKFKYTGEVFNLWDSALVNHSGNTYTITNNGWNQDILPGESIRIGFTGDTCFTEYPTDYELTGESKENKLEDYSI